MGFSWNIKNASQGYSDVFMVMSNNLQSKASPLLKTKSKKRIIIWTVDCTYILLQLPCPIRELEQALSISGLI